MSALGGPAYRIETERLVIRCYDPRDASLLQEAVEASLEHLRPWMPWVDEEPLRLAERVGLLRSFRGRFDLGQDFIYGIFAADESQILGGTGLHTRRGIGVREIGYWIRAGHLRRGLASESTAALVRVAFEIDGVRRVEIRCDPRNEASAAIPHKLGFQMEGVLRGRDTQRGAARDTQVWSLVSEDYASSPASEVELQAYDVLGGLLLEG